MNDFDLYQDFTDTTVKEGEAKRGLTYPVLGLASEAGEVADKLKKNIRDSGGVWTSEDALAMTKELGDVLWYVAQIARRMGVPLSKVIQLNVAKLEHRKIRNQIGGTGDNR